MGLVKSGLIISASIIWKEREFIPPNSFPTVNRCQGVDLFVPFEMLPDRHQVATHL